MGSLGRVLEGLGVVLGLSSGCLGGVLGGFLGVWEGSKGSQKSLGKAKMHFQDLTENIEKKHRFSYDFPMFFRVPGRLGGGLGGPKKA